MNKALYDIYFTSPFVIGMRMPLLMAEAFLPVGRRPETDRAIGEKIEASLETAMAVQSAILVAWLEAPWLIASGWSAAQIASRTSNKAGAAAVGPFQRRVRSNVKRLRGF